MKFLENVLFRRPRLLNLLHSLHLVRATSQTNEAELKMIEKYAVGKRLAVEIGSYQGVSAARIASVMADDGILYCIDPWDRVNGKPNPCYEIFQRHVKRVGIWSKVRVVQTASREARDTLPADVDFIFVDGDHSWSGIACDWSLVRAKLCDGGVVCLHDSLVPTDEPWRTPDSVRYFQQVILRDPGFRQIDSSHTLAVLRRVEGNVASQTLT